jgi:hypothetical protein
MQKALLTLLVLCIAAIFSTSPAIGQNTYCWKDSYTRGVGTIPSDCAFSQEKQGLLCYPKCNDGYTGVASVCWQNCPDGFTDDGAFCRKPAAYGRGWGYAWQIQDGFSNAGMLSRCEAAEGRPCEMWGAMAYPTCKDGFTPFGSNVCTPVCPSGMTDIGVSCAKQTYTRPTATATCAPGQVYEAGLCYVTCRPGYEGVGPVCWGACPTDKPYPCAAGCATNANTCAQATTDQVLSVLQAVSSIALEAVSFGTSTAVVRGIEAGVKAGTKLGVSAAAKSMTTAVTRKTVVDAIQNAAVSAGKSIATTEAETIATALGTYDVQALGQVAAGADPPDFDWTSLDPTGIASIVQAYNHPVCAAPPPGTAVPGYSPTGAIPLPATTISSSNSQWLLYPGLATDIGVTGGGTAWIISAGLMPSGGYGIFRLQPGDANWTQVPGAAVRIAAGGDQVWVVNSWGAIFRWNPAIYNWDTMPGWANDVAVDAVGNAFVIGRDGTIWEMKAGQSVWTAVPTPAETWNSDSWGPVVRIAASGVEQMWVTNGTSIMKWTGNNDRQNPVWKLVQTVLGTVTDIAASPDGLAFWTVDGNWQPMAGTSPPTLLPPAGDTVSLSSVAAGGPGRVWVVKTDGRIFKYIGK